ncbi:MAG: Mur ligase family protein [Minisyncoccia bacterium]
MNISDLYTIFINECNQIISTDTRDIVPGSLFFAWRGGQQDGNQYATEALEKGAQYVVIDNPDYDLGDSYILVTDSVEALGLLAQHHRRQFDIPVIGLTGSNGKTTTKELIASVLQTEKNIVAPIKSYNNFVGVSKTLLEIDADTE